MAHYKIVMNNIISFPIFTILRGLLLFPILPFIPRPRKKEKKTASNA